MTYAKKPDANHEEIRDGLRQCGYRVFDSHHFGDGFPDLVVQNRDGVIVLVEIKSPRGRFTAAEKNLHNLFTGAENIAVVRSLEDALVKLDRIAQWFRNY